VRPAAGSSADPASAPSAAEGASGSLGEAQYRELLARLQTDLAIEGRLEQMEELIGHLDRQVDRLLREIAKRDPGTQWEPEAQGQERAAR
jgi:hypothetical protein